VIVIAVAGHAMTIVKRNAPNLAHQRLDASGHVLDFVALALNGAPLYLSTGKFDAHLPNFNWS
jgi:hypothetical protein